MVVLGIDPGSATTGFGVIRSQGGRLSLVEAGCIRTRTSDPVAARLARIHAGLVEVIERSRPDAVAIEAIFHHRSSASALKLGQARGVALLAAGQHGYAPFEYNPSTVKRSVGAHGKADKHALARIVTMLLGARPEGPADVTDALAIAITHCAHTRTARALAGQR